MWLIHGMTGILCFLTTLLFWQLDLCSPSRISGFFLVYSSSYNKHFHEHCLLSSYFTHSRVQQMKQIHNSSSLLMDFTLATALNAFVSKTNIVKNNLSSAQSLKSEGECCLA